MNKIVKKCLIISGGDFTEKEKIRMSDPDLVIACDRGYRHAAALGIVPDLIVGDFDSAPRSGARARDVRTFPTEKDDTDTMLAVKEALSRGCGIIEITCFGGGRLDHLFANLQTGAYIASAGARAVLTSDDAAVFVEKAPLRLALPFEEGCSLSVFSLSDECTGVTIQNAKYETDHVRITNTFPVGVSNEWPCPAAGTGKTSPAGADFPADAVPDAVISAEKGILAVMICQKPAE